MKRMSLLMSMATALVVGGVYATWSYSQGSVAAATDEYAVVMTAETISGEKGAFDVSSSSITFEIENKGDYKPELIATGDVIVYFTPSLGADSTVINEGIDIKWSLGFCTDGATNWMYDSDFNGTEDKMIFLVDSGATTIYNTASVKESGRFKFTIPASTLLTKITLNVTNDFVLDTKAKYESFSQSLRDYHFVLTVSEVA